MDVAFESRWILVSWHDISVVSPISLASPYLRNPSLHSASLPGHWLVPCSNKAGTRSSGTLGTAGMLLQPTSLALRRNDMTSGLYIPLADPGGTPGGDIQRTIIVHNLHSISPSKKSYDDHQQIFAVRKWISSYGLPSTMAAKLWMILNGVAPL